MVDIRLMNEDEDSQSRERQARFHDMSSEGTISDPMIFKAGRIGEAFGGIPPNTSISPAYASRNQPRMAVIESLDTKYWIEQQNQSDDYTPIVSEQKNALQLQPTDSEIQNIAFNPNLMPIKMPPKQSVANTNYFTGKKKDKTVPLQSITSNLNEITKKSIFRNRGKPGM